MKIAFIVPSLIGKGPVRVVYDVVKNFPEEMKKNTTIYYFDEKLELDFPCRKCKIGLFSKINLNDYDIIHTHGIRPDFYMFFRRFKFQGKYFSTLHSYLHSDLKFQYNSLIAKLFAPLWIYLVKKADSVVVLSHDMKNYYSRYIQSGKLNVISNGRNIEEQIDIDEVDNALFRELNNNYDLILGAVCAVTKRKGLDQALPILEKNPSWVLVVVGSGKEVKNLKLEAANRGIDNIRFIGHKSNGYRYYKHFDLALMLSRSEGFPLSLIEAAALEVPLVCSDLQQFKDILNDDDVSYFQIENIPDLENAIRKALENKQSLVKNMKSKYSSNFTAEIMSKNHLNLYNAFLDN